MTVYYSVHTGYPVDPEGYPESFITELAPPAPGYKFVEDHWEVAEQVVEAKLKYEKTRVSEAINDRVLVLYNKYAPLQMEYTMRESQAKAWMEDSYDGDPPSQVRAFSEPANMNPIQACTLIIQQAVEFRAALDFAATLRMRKHGVKTATSIADLRRYEQSTLAQIDYVISMLN